MAGKLTEVQIKHWVRAGEPIARSDGGGLTFTLSKAGAAVWVLRYRFGGKGRELTLGSYPDLSLVEARKEAAEKRVDVQRGIDIAREKQRRKQASKADWTMRELIADYSKKILPTLAANTVLQRRRYLNKPITAKLGHLRARDVDGADLVEILSATGKRSASAAEVVYTILNELFKHALAQHIVKQNPMAGLSLKAIIGKPEPVRQRLKLTEPELRLILPALPEIGEENALAVKILLATCVRVSELVKAEWRHIDLEQSVWLIPAENSKTGNDFTIPLPLPVAEWFKRLHLLACNSAYVLPARQARRRRNQGGDTHIAQHAMNAALHRLCDRLGDQCRRFSPHDLRSTARSWLSELGVAVPVAERCLNHSLGGLLKIYDQYDYLTERREALTLWTRFIVACEQREPWKVVSIEQARRTR